MDGNSSDVIADVFALPGVEPSSNLDSERPHLIGYRASAPNSASWPVERDQEPIPQRLDLTSSKPRDISPNRGMMGVQKIAPAPVTQACSFVGGTCDIGEKKGGEHAIRGNGRLWAVKNSSITSATSAAFSPTNGM